MHLCHAIGTGREPNRRFGPAIAKVAPGKQCQVVRLKSEDCTAASATIHGKRLGLTYSALRGEATDVSRREKVSRYTAVAQWPQGVSAENDEMTLGGIEPAAGEGQPKAKIFISYSHCDLDFADRLDAGLKARGFDTLIDRREIYALEDWWQRIEALIVQADTIVFVLSPDAVASDICQREVKFAASLNKRLAPIVCRRVDDAPVPETLARLNYIFFDDASPFDDSLNELSEALETDIDWVRQHTAFGEQARRWTAAGRPGPRGLLLRSPVLEEAERWIASRPHGAPTPTEDAQAFIAESRRAATQRRNILTGSLAGGLLVALVLAGFAYWQRGVAVAQEKVAVEQRDLARLNESRFLTAQARTVIKQGDPNLGAAIARAALPTDMRHPDRRLWAEAVGILAEERGSIPMVKLEGHTEEVVSAAWSSDGTRIVTGSSTARIWNATTRTMLVELKGHSKPVNLALWSPDGTRVLTTSDDGTARVWDAKTGKELLLLTQSGAISDAAWDGDGARIVTASWDRTAQVWDANTGARLATLGHQKMVSSVAWSPDGERIATASADGTARVWDAKKGTLITLLRGHSDKVISAVWSVDGSRIYTVSDDRSARVWDAKTGAQLDIIETGSRGDAPYWAAWSPNRSHLVASSSADTARVWTVGDTKSVVLAGDTEGVTNAFWSPHDGSRILTVSNDKTARIWDAETGAELAILAGHQGLVVSAAWSPDESRIVTASWDKTAGIWDAWPLLTSKTITYAAITAAHRLTATERADLGLELPRRTTPAQYPDASAMSLDQLLAAAAAGNPYAHARLSELYQKGEGVQANAELALFHIAVAIRLFEGIGDEDHVNLATVSCMWLSVLVSPEAAVRVAYEAMDWKAH